jgi:hypothetical protein
VSARIQPTTALTGREHADLQTAAHAINDHHRQVEESLRAGFSGALTHAIEAGRKLAYAKSLVPHGGWGPWVDRNLPAIDARTERLYRQLAEAADAGRLQTGNAVPLSSIRQARELLAQTAAGPANSDASTTTPTGSEAANSQDSHASARWEPMRWQVAARRLAKHIDELLASCRKLFGGPNFKSAGRELYDALADLYGDEGALEVIDELSAVVSSARARAERVAQV